MNERWKILLAKSSIDVATSAKLYIIELEMNYSLQYRGRSFEVNQKAIGDSAASSCDFHHECTIEIQIDHGNLHE